MLNKIDWKRAHARDRPTEGKIRTENRNCNRTLNMTIIAPGKCFWQFKIFFSLFCCCQWDIQLDNTVNDSVGFFVPVATTIKQSKQIAFVVHRYDDDDDANRSNWWVSQLVENMTVTTMLRNERSWTLITANRSKIITLYAICSQLQNVNLLLELSNRALVQHIQTNNQKKQHTK